MSKAQSISKMLVEIYSHHFTVYVCNPQLRQACSDLSRGLVEWVLDRIPGHGKPRFVRVPSRVYASATLDRSEMRFNINLLDQFKTYCESNGLKLDDIEFRHIPMYEPENVTLIWKSSKVPYENQLPSIEYLAQPLTQEPTSRIVCAATGQGKGLMAVQAMVRLGVRVAIVVRAGYLQKWEEELEEFLQLDKEDLMVVRGGEAMIAMLNLALADKLNAKILLISNKSIQLYLKSYEHYHVTFSDHYPVQPEEFYKILKVGVRLIDEVHLDFHLNFKQDTYAHVPVTMSLSATIDSDQPLINRMYLLMWPANTRGPTMSYTPYIDVKCLWYRAGHPERLRYTNYKKQYTHVEFENSILRNKQMFREYLKIPELIVRTKFVPNYIQGQKMLIFCSTIAMCTEVVRHLKLHFPTFSIAKYTGEDDWEQLHNNDIVVSTIQSAGTAVDIRNLRYTLLTVSLSSKQTNHQVLGRLRKLKDFPEVTPEFMYTACSNIGKQVEYAIAKKEKLHGKVKHFSEAYLPVII